MQRLEKGESHRNLQERIIKRVFRQNVLESKPLELASQVVIRGALGEKVYCHLRIKLGQKVELVAHKAQILHQTLPVESLAALEPINLFFGIICLFL